MTANSFPVGGFTCRIFPEHPFNLADTPQRPDDRNIPGYTPIKSTLYETFSVYNPKISIDMLCIMGYTLKEGDFNDQKRVVFRANQAVYR